MEKSETIGKLSEALSKAQATISGAKMDSDNPFFKSKYADLTSVWEACRKPLTDNGLAVVQVSCAIPDKPEYVVIETILTHSSGEWIKGRLAMKPVKADPQGVGSCITYARRYSLAAMVGISPEDDDGNAASGNEKKQGSKNKTENTQSQTQSGQNAAPEYINENQKKAIEAIIGKNNLNRDSVKEFLYSKNYMDVNDQGNPTLTKLHKKVGEGILKKPDDFVKGFNEWQKRREAA